MHIALWIIFLLITTPVLLFINWMIWFRLLPITFRLFRDQLRRLRER